MLNQGLVLSEPLLEGAVTHAAHGGGRNLTLMSVFLGLAMAILRSTVLSTRSGSRQVKERSFTLASAASWPWQKHRPGSLFHRTRSSPKAWAEASAKVAGAAPILSSSLPVHLASSALEGRAQKLEMKDVERVLCTSNVSSSSSYQIRRFDPARDQTAVENICKNVYGGTDYLPKIAASLANDPSSLFVVLEDQYLGQPVAVANVRKFKPSMAWLEAVRTSEEHQGKGFAARLTEYLIDHCKSGDHEVYTCTAKSNKAMQRVFEKTGLLFLHQIHQLSFSKLKELQGWSRDDHRPSEPLLQAYGLQSRIGEQARNEKWSQVESEEEFESVMQDIRKAGGIGHLPGVWELLSANAGKVSIANGRMWKLEATGKAAVLAFSKDPKIESLKSQWVCSVAASTPEALESALWHAHSEACLATLEGDVAFTVSMDGMVPPAMCESLPLVEDPCVIFGTSCSV